VLEYNLEFHFIQRGYYPDMIDPYVCFDYLYSGKTASGVFTGESALEEMMDNPLRDSEGAPISMDKEGRWFYYDAEIVNEKVSLLFAQHLERDQEGRYVISLWGDTAHVELEDTPYVVFRALRREDGGGPPYFDIYLNDGSCEKLDPASLQMGEENVLYCRVKEGRHRARFNRNSVHQLLKYLEYDEPADEYYLKSDGVRHRIG
jgi:hypothetical protein